MKTIYAEFKNNGCLTDDFNYDSLMLEGEDNSIKITAVLPLSDDGSIDSVRVYIRTADGSGYIEECNVTGIEHNPATVSAVYPEEIELNSYFYINGKHLHFTIENLPEGADDYYIDVFTSMINELDCGVVATNDGTNVFLTASGTTAEDKIIIGIDNCGFKVGTYNPIATRVFCELVLSEKYMIKGNLRVGFEAYGEKRYKRFEPIVLSVNPFVDVSGGSGSSSGYTVTVAVDSVNTLEPGSLATVENIGTSKDVKFVFGIPKGEKGADGETGPQGPQGIQGGNGKSAYEVALDNGFEGTETEWLESLKGKSAISPKGTTVTLYNADWDSEGFQNIIVEGVTKNNKVIISPVPTQENLMYYSANQVVCEYQGEGYIAFRRYKSSESEDLYVNILIYPESEGTV